MLETGDEVAMASEGDGGVIGGTTVTMSLKRIERADALSIHCIDEMGR
jgi:hypothetical protein